MKITDHHQFIDELNWCFTSVVAALGYRNSSDKYATAPKVRFPLDQVVQRV